ncbi:NPCBM/NEW2 domain-containing protein [Kocuria sp. CH-021]|uniref:NPCBM/NEW2 domain-containing protein n=1 Tax=Kocuria sp. CH-021 TaxID=3406735 RepID=UPI003C713BE6
MIFVLVLLLAAATAVIWSVAADDSSKTARVGKNGISMSVADARISAPAGVAVEGTTISAESTDVDVSGVAWDSATALREGLSIVLEDEAQPQQPVQLQFTIPDDVQIPEDGTVFVVAYSAETEDPELLPTQWDAGTRTATATTEHFSKFVPVLIEAAKAAAGFARALDRVITLKTNQPSCFGQDPLEGDASITVSKIRGNAVWPCLSLGEGKLRLNLQSSSSLIWKLTSTPEPDEAAPNPRTGAGLFVAHAHAERGAANKESLVLPNETASIDYSVDDLPIDVRMDVAPGLMILHTIGLASSEILPADWALLVGGAECLNDFSELVNDDTAYDDIFIAGLTCLGAAVGGPPGAVLAMVAGAPGALYGSFYGFLSTVFQQDVHEFRIKLSVPAAAKAPAPGTVPLWQLDARSGGLSGDSVDSWVRDGDSVTLHPGSTSQWVGCFGSVQDTTYRLRGDYSRLNTTVALRQGTPAGMNATFEFLLDDELAHTVTVTEGTAGEIVDLDLTGAQELTVTAATDDECTNESLAYGTLLGAAVTKSEGADLTLGDVSELKGFWKGAYGEPGSSDYYTMETNLQLGADDQEPLEGQVTYPELECRGTWAESRRTAEAIFFTQWITEGASFQCADNSTVKVTRTEKGLRASVESPRGTDDVRMALL